MRYAMVAVAMVSMVIGCSGCITAEDALDYADRYQFHVEILGDGSGEGRGAYVSARVVAFDASASFRVTLRDGDDGGRQLFQWTYLASTGPQGYMLDVSDGLSIRDVGFDAAKAYLNAYFPAEGP